MENQNQNTTSGYANADQLPVTSVDLGGTAQIDNGAQALSRDPENTQYPVIMDAESPPHRSNRVLRQANYALFVMLLLLGAVGLVVVRTAHRQRTSGVNSITQQYGTVQLPLNQFSSSVQGLSLGASNVVVNGSLKLNQGVTITPSVQPNSPTAGQLYYDQNTNQLAYYNGTNFVPLSAQGQVVQSIGGLTGQIVLGGGLTVVGNQLISVNNGVTSLGGKTGAITLGTGLAMNGNALQNSGVLNVLAGTGISVSSDGNGNITVSNTGTGTGTVTSSGGTSGALALFTGSQNIEDSIVAQSGGVITVSGGLTVTGAVSLSSPLTVANGGTGVNTFANNGVVIGQGGSPLATVTAGGAGLCFLSTGGAPTFAACPSASGVTSLNGLTGALSVANASGASSTITIDDATTAAKGIASFNSNNFTVGSGAVNTIQNIGTTATPTFSGVNANSLTPSATLTVGATGQQLVLQGNASTQLTATGGGFTTTVGFTGAPTGAVTYNFDRTAAVGTYTLCSTAGNCVGAGGGVTTPGGTTGTIPKFTGAQTIGDSLLSESGATVSLSGNLFLTGSISGGTTYSGSGNINTTGGVIQTNSTTRIDNSGNLLNIGNITGTGAITIASSGAGNNVIIDGANQFVVQDAAVFNGTATFNTTTNFTLADTENVTITNTVTGTNAVNLISSALTNNTTSGTQQIALLQNASGTGTTEALLVLDNADADTAVTNGLQITSAAGGITTAIDVSDSDIGTALSFGANDIAGTNFTLTGSNGSFTSAGNATLQGGSVTIGTTSQAGSLLLHDGSSNTGTLLTAALGQNTVYTLPDPGGAAATICLTTGNCAGAGGGVTGSGTNNQLAKFTSTGSTIGDSTISDNGATVTTSVDLIIQGGDLTLGIASSQTGSIAFKHSGSANTGTITQGALGGNRTYTLPDATGTFCLTSGNCSGTGSSNTLQAAYDAGSTIATTDARDLSITLADTSTDSSFTITTATGSTGFTSIARADGAGTSDPAQLLLIDNLDTNRAQPTGLKLQSAAGGLTTAIDASDAEIGTALSVGANDIVGTTGNITYSNFTVAGASGDVTGGTYNGQTISNAANFTGTLAVQGNTTLTGDIAVNGGDITSTGALNITPGGTLTVGGTGQTLVLQGDGSSRLTATDSGNTTTVGFAAPTANTTLNFPALSAGAYTICTTSGNCAGAGVTLQAAYNNSSNPEIVVDATRGALTVRDNATPIGTNLLEVQSNNGGTTYLGVTASALTLGSNVDINMQGATAYISNPQTQSQSEAFGLNASVTGTNALAAGYNAIAATTGVALGRAANANSLGGPVAVGDSATAGDWGVAIGQGSGTGTRGTAVGTLANATQDAIAIGYNASATLGGVALGSNAATGGNNRIVIGSSATATADFQLVIGGSSAVGSVVSDAYIGSGVTDTTPQDVTLQGTGGSGSNVAGATFNLASGRSTGSANGGNLNFQVSAPGGAGSGLNSLTTVATLSGANGSALFKNAVNSASAFQIQNASAADTLLTVDTTARGAGGGNRIKVGNSTGTDGNLTILQLDAATADPTSNLAALNGGLFYNSTTHKVSLIENGAVKVICNTTDLGCGTGTVTLQNAYNNSAGAAPSVLTTSGNKAVTIQTANSGGIAAGNELFGVRANHSGDTIGNSLFTVNSTGVGINIGGTGNPATTADLSFGSGANRTINVIQSGSGVAGNSLAIQSGGGGSGGTGADGGGLTLQGGDAGGSTAADGGTVLIKGGSAASGGETGQVVIQAGSGDRNEFLSVRNAAGDPLLVVNSANGDLYLGTATPSSNYALTFANNTATKTIGADDSTTGNGTGIKIQGGSTSFAGADGGSVTLSAGSPGGGGAAGGVLVKNLTDSTTGFHVQNSSGSTVFGVDTLNRRVTIQGGASQTADLFRLQDSTTANIFRLDSVANLESIGYFNNGYGGLGPFENLLTFSEQFDNAAWTKTSVTAPTANTIVAPDGQTTAESLADSASGGSVSQTSGTAPTNNNYTFSVWLKTGSGTQSVDLRIDGATTGTGTVQTVTATTTWQRFSVTQNTNGFTGNIKVFIYPGGQFGTGTVHAWGAELGKSSVPQVYARTTSTTVTANRGIVSNGGAFISSLDASDIPLVIQAAPSQSSDLMQFQNASGTVLAKVDASGVLTATGVNGGGGLIQGTGGLTVTGTVSINHDANFNTRINTGTSTGTLTLGGGSAPLVIDSTNFDVSSGGALSGITGYSQASGNFAQSGSGSFGTGTGTVSLNGSTTIAATKALTVTSGLTSLTGDTSGDALNVSNSTSSGNIAVFKDNATAVMTIANGGGVTFSNQTNSASAFVVQNATAADTLFTIDTAARSGSGGNLIKIGNSTGTDTNLTILQLDAATADPTSNLSALNGGMFYNSVTNKVSLVENGQVKVICNTTDLGCGTGTVTLQSAYGNGNTISTTSSRDIAFTLANNSNFTVATAAAATGFTTFSLTDGSNASPPAQLVLVKNNDTNQVLGAGISVQSAAGGVTTAFDASGSNITNALAIGGNAISGTNFSVTGAGAVTAVGVNAGSGLLQGTGGLTVSGTINLGSVGSSTAASTVHIADTSDGTGTQAVTIGTNAKSANTLVLDAGTAATAIQIGNTATAHGIQIGTGAAQQTVVMGSTNGGSALTLQAGTGGLNITTQGTGALAVGNNAVAQTINIGNSTSSTAVTIASGTGNLSLTTQGTGTLGVGNNGVAQTIAIGNGTGATTVSVSCGTGLCGFGNNAIDHSTTVGSTTGTSLTTLQGGTGGLALKGTGSGNVVVGTSDTTGTLLVVDTKTNSGDPTSVDGGIYYNSSLAEFRCAENGAWRSCMGNARTSYHFSEEMLAAQSYGVLGFAFSGDGGFGTAQSGVIGRPGIVDMDTGTGATNWADVGDAQSDTIILLGNSDYWHYQSSIRIPTLSSGTQRFTLRGGFKNGAADSDTNNVDECVLEYSDNINSGKWQGVCNDFGATNATCNTNLTVVANTWYRLDVVVNASGVATFSVDGANSCSVSTHVPTASGHATGFHTTINKAIGTTNRQVDIDYFEITGQLGNNR